MSSDWNRKICWHFLIHSGTMIGDRSESPHIVTATSGIYFKSSSILPEDPSRAINIIKFWKKDRKIIRINVSGHTDRNPLKPSPGSLIKDNKALGLERARAVAAIIKKSFGLKSTAIIIESCGSRRTEIYGLKPKSSRVVELEIWFDSLPNIEE